MSMTASGSAVSIVYDGDGNRVSKTVNGVTTQYLVDNLNPTGYGIFGNGVLLVRAVKVGASWGRADSTACFRSTVFPKML
jgi:YD repeat-containing protein